MPIFSFPDDAAWNDAAGALQFSIEIGEYKGVVTVPRPVFQALLPERPVPERCVEAYYLDRSRFERAAAAKVTNRQLTADGNIELSLRDLRGVSKPPKAP